MTQPAGVSVPIQVGLKGEPGDPAYTTTTAPVTMPAPGSTALFAVGSSRWMGVGAPVNVTGLGSFTVSSTPTPTSAVLANTGAPGNMGAGNTVGSGQLVAPSGPSGPSSLGMATGVPTATGAGVEVPAAYGMRRVEYTQALTGAVVITWPTPFGASAYYEATIANLTSGAHTLAFTCGGGAQVTVTQGKTAILGFKASGDVVRITPDT